jgi:hypothetical protein
LSRRPPGDGTTDGRVRAGVDVAFVWSTFARFGVPVWFIALSAMRLVSVVPITTVGFDGRLYRAATVAWLAGGDPWQVQLAGAYFAAPPPMLLAMAPFALVPESVAVVALIALGVGATAWALRRLRMPLWWLAFPPLVDGLYNANPHVILMPLVLSGAAWVAPIVKAYVAPVLLLRRQYRALVIAALVTLVTVPITPWGTFLGEVPRVLKLLGSQTNGGLSVWQVPLLAAPAAIAVWYVGLERAAWWIVPVFWPSTQYYYNSLAIPALTPIAAMVLAGQFPGVPAVAIIVSAAEIAWHRRRAVTIGAARLEPDGA